MNTLFRSLINQLPHPGRVEWIGVRPAHQKLPSGKIEKQRMHVVDAVEARTDQGLVGDRYSSKNGKRQVTLIQAEHLAVIASLLEKPSISPELLRRNIVVAGINLLALKGKCFSIGSATLEYTGLCEPCSAMEQALGLGGYNVMRGHGGITARINESGIIRLGDKVTLFTGKPSLV